MSETTNTVNITEVVNRFYENNENLKTLKKVCEEEKSTIKSYILNNENNDIENNTVFTDIAKASVVEVKKQSFKEAELIEFLTPYNIPGLIEYKPVINNEVLQDSLYHGDINPKDIEKFIVEDITYRLDVKKNKRK